MARRFENYKILAELGRGGMGIVYKALDERTNKIVAIKQLILENIDQTKHREFRDRFRREAQTALRLQHANIVTVLEISQDPDSYFYVMEFLEGHSLRKEIARQGGKCDLLHFYNILQQVALGLSYAHSMNVIHRDVKPDNVFILKDGTVKITDFGIARVADLEETTLTKTGVMLGTLAYVSPEQLQNAKTVDHRADIFSLGVLSYEALSGDLPFTGDGIAATIVKIMSAEETPLHMVNPQISVEISGTISRALRKRPRDRYRSVNEFIRDFKLAAGIDKGELRYDTGDIDPFVTSADLGQSRPYDATTANLQEVDTDPGSDLTEHVEQFDDRSNEEAAGGQEDQEKVPDTTFASMDVSDFGLKISLDKDGILDEKTRAKISTSGKHKPIGWISSPNIEMKQDKSLETSAELPTDQAHVTPPPGVARPAAGMAARMAAKTNAPYIQPTYNPIKLAYSIKQQGSNNKPLVEPTVAAYRSGRLLVGDTATRTIHMYSRDGRWLCDLVQRPEIGNSKTGGGRLTKPSGIALDERGRIYVCDSSDHYIRIFDGQGSFIKEFKNIQGLEGGLSGITIDSTGLLYVSDSMNGCLQVFQSDVGVWVRSIASKGEEAGQLQLPSGLATDRLNRVYVVDYGTCMVSIFNKAGALVRTFGKKGNQRGMFNVPRGVAVDRNDRIFILDSLNHRIQVFGQAGDWLYTFGSLGAGPEEFVGPQGIAIDNENNLLFVADKGNKRIQVLELGFK